MSIDPNLVFGIKQPQATDPLEQFAKAASLRNILAQQQDRAQRAEETALDIQEKRRQMSAAEQHRQLFADPQTAAMMKDAPEKLVPLLYSIDPKFGSSYETGLAARKKDKLEREGLELGIAEKKADRIGSIIQSASDPKTGFIPDEATAHQVVSRMMGEGLIDKEHSDQFFSMPWGAETQSAIAQFGMGSIKAKDQIQARREAAKAEQEKEKHDADMLKGKAELPGIKADTKRKEAVTAGMVGGMTESEKSLADSRKAASKNLNIVDVLLDPGKHPPERVKKAQQLWDKQHERVDPGVRPMTPALRSQIEATKNTEMEQAQAEADEAVKEEGLNNDDWRKPWGPTSKDEDPAKVAERKKLYEDSQQKYTAIQNTLARRRQFIQNAYEGQITAATGVSPGHYEYPAQGKPAAPAAAPPAQPPSTAPSQPQAAAPQMTEAQARAKAIAAGRDPDLYIDALRKQKLIQ